MIRETAAVRTRSVKGPTGEIRRFDGNSTGADQAFERGEDSFRAPARAEDPGKLRQNNQGNEDTASGPCFRQRSSGALCLSGIVIEQGARPNVGVGYDHRQILLALAAFISSKVIGRLGLLP